MELATRDSPGRAGRLPFEVARVLATGQPFEAEVRIRRAADGDYRWFTESAVPLRDEQGNIRKWYGVLADVEDRKQAEYLTRQVFESSPDGICIIGSDYRYRTREPGLRAGLGDAAREDRRQAVADLLGAEVSRRRSSRDWTGVSRARTSPMRVGSASFPGGATWR